MAVALNEPRYRAFAAFDDFTCGVSAGIDFVDSVAQRKGAVVLNDGLFEHGCLLDPVLRRAGRLRSFAQKGVER